MLKGLHFLASVSTVGGITAGKDPMDILTNNTGIDTGANSVFTLLDFGGLVWFLRNYALIFGAIALVIDFVILMFVNRPDAIAEKKQDVAHRILIILLIVNAVPIAGIVMNFFQSIMALGN